MKIWGILLFLSGILWSVDVFRIIFGYQPDKFSMIVAFIITSVTVFKWAYEEFTE